MSLGTSTLSTGTLIVTAGDGPARLPYPQVASTRQEGGPEDPSIRAALDGYDHVLAVADPRLRAVFHSTLLPLLRPHVATEEITLDHARRRPPPPRPPHSAVLAFGGGTTLDAAKLLAADSGTDWIAVPSKPTSAAFSATASIKERGHVSTTMVRPPRSVVLLPEVVCATPAELLTAELFDTWSFQTAVADVVLDGAVNGSGWDTSYVPVLNEVTSSLAELCPADLRRPAALRRFVEAQKLLADVTNHERTTRYVSGVEHLIAHVLDARGCRLAHGLQVGLGIALGLALQRSNPALRSELSRRGLMDMPDPAWLRVRGRSRRLVHGGHVRRGLLEEALRSAPSVRETHRFTVLDLVSREERRAALEGLLS